MLFEYNPIPIWIYDVETWFISDANRAAQHRYGYALDDFKKMTIRELFPENEFKKIEQALKHSTNGKKTIGICESITNKGESVFVEISDQAYENSENKRLLLAHDVTNHVQLEEKLSKAYQQLSFHVNNSPLGFLELDNNLKVKKWSKKSEEIFGWTFDEIKGKKLNEFNFVFEGDENFVLPLLSDLASGQRTSAIVQNRNRTRNGEILICEWYNSVLFDDDGNLVSILGQVQNITQQHKNEFLILEQKRILEMIASGEGLKEILHQIIFLIEKNTNNAHCSILIRDNEGKLRLGAAPGFPEELNNMIDGIEIGRGNGVCGHAAYTGEEVLVDDFDSDPLLKDWQAAVKIVKELGLNVCGSTPVFSSDGEVIGTFAFYYEHVSDIHIEFHDIVKIGTNLAGIAIDRDRHQEILAESETKFKTVFEYANDGIFIMDDDRYVDCNRHVLEMFGCSKSEILGKCPADFSPKKQNDGRLSKEKALDKINNALNGKPQYFTWTNLKASGEPLEVQVSLNRVPIGGKFYIQAIVHDITKEKQAEYELLQNRQRLSKLLENLPGMVYRCRNDRDWTLDFVSEGCYELTGYTVDELMDDEWRRFSSLILPEDREQVWQDVQDALNKNQPYELEYRIRTKSGDIKWVWEKGSSIFLPDKKDINLEGFITDITDRKKAERNIMRSLEEKEVLLSEIHHRVKNNLAVISGLLQLQAYNAKDSDVQDILYESQNRIQSIAMIHEKLYQSDTFAHIELKNYISDLVNNIRNTYNKKNIKITIEADEIYLNITEAIPCALILNELIVNAFKHAFKKMQKGRVTIEMAQSKGYINLKVRDNGVGLPDDFGMVSKKALGMTLIKTLVKQLNAELEINQQKGTEFSILFKTD